MKKFEVFYFKGNNEETITIEAYSFAQVYTSLEQVLYQNELKSIYRIEEIYTHDDEKFADEVVDDEILNSYVGAPN